VTGILEHGIQNSGPIKCEEFFRLFERLSAYQGGLFSMELVYLLFSLVMTNEN